MLFLFQELNKVQLKPFLMRIWGQGDAQAQTGESDALAQAEQPDAPAHTGDAQTTEGRH